MFLKGAGSAVQDVWGLEFRVNPKPQTEGSGFNVGSDLVMACFQYFYRGLVDNKGICYIGVI